MNEVNGKKVWFKRHEDDDWFDEVTLQTEDIYAEDSFVNVGSREDWMERAGLKWDALRIEYRRLA